MIGPKLPPHLQKSTGRDNDDRLDENDEVKPILTECCFAFFILSYCSENSIPFSFSNSFPKSELNVSGIRICLYLLHINLNLPIILCFARKLSFRRPIYLH